MPRLTVGHAWIGILVEIYGGTEQKVREEKMASRCRVGGRFVMVQRPSTF